MIRAYNFNLTFNVCELYTGVVITTFVYLVGSLDESIQRQWFIPYTLTATTPDVMICRLLFKLTVFRTNYLNFTYSCYI